VYITEMRLQQAKLVEG